jgi:hypothetical protein
VKAIIALRKGGIKAPPLIPGPINSWLLERMYNASTDSITNRLFFNAEQPQYRC